MAAVVVEDSERKMRDFRLVSCCVALFWCFEMGQSTWTLKKS